MGTALGTLWTHGGHTVSFSYSRDPKKLDAVAREAGKTSRAATPADAVRDSEVVLVAVPWHRLDDVLASAGGKGAFDTRIVITCTLPMTPDDSALAVGHTTSGAEELARRLPGARVVAAFNTIPSELLHKEVLARRPGVRPEVIQAGDDSAAKEVVAKLIEDVGLDAIDAGPLAIARYLEPFGLLIAQLAYTQELGPELGYAILRFTNDSLSDA
jgi:predicted dinucleotide-binding enzyme